MPVARKSIYLFANGSTIKTKSKPIYYSDVVSNFFVDSGSTKISFNVNDLSYKFPNGSIGLRDINLSEGQGKLVGIMGASGAGKTTLLNTLIGNSKPYSGEILLNGIDIYREKNKIEGVFGYIPQDDLLIEELTVFQNLYFNAKLCFKDLEEEDLVSLVHNVLHNLGLIETKDLKVGSPLNKTISGGQRKRLNIALELIREPSVLFVDEPTSGLSSRDSENVMDLLRELALKGKLVFVVIHQPSSDIYKMFDRVIILDTGGYLIYNGNPVEAISYFKKLDNQVNSEVSECPTCGNVNPELIFNIIEAKVVDEYGNFTDQRKVSPEQWREHFVRNILLENIPDVVESPPKSLSIPFKWEQFKIYTQRDFWSKISNRQYVIINLLEVPLLAFFLSFIIRYVGDSEIGEYIYRENDNIPAYIFMCIIVGLFVGLTVSAEEIFRDRKILKRESFLNLSRGSYLFSKIAILFTLSALQSLLLVLVGNSILEIRGMYLDYWLVMFSVFCFANVAGLNISAAFNSAVTIYILIPLLIIPQMVLGGAMFSYDKLNKFIGGGHHVPFIAEWMTSRWAYEALTVNQFMNNKWQAYFYDLEAKESECDYKQAYYIPELQKRLAYCQENLNSDDDSVRMEMEKQLTILRNEIKVEGELHPQVRHLFFDSLNVKSFDRMVLSHTRLHLDILSMYYSLKYDTVFTKKEFILNKLQDTPENEAKFNRVRDNYYNNNLSDLMKNNTAKHELVAVDGRLIQVIDPIFYEPIKPSFINLKAHFFAPAKFLLYQKISTFTFNVIMIWVMTCMLFVVLYFDGLSKFLDFFDNFKQKA